MIGKGILLPKDTYAYCWVLVSLVLLPAPGRAPSDISVRNWIVSALWLKAFILIQVSLDCVVPVSKVLALIADLGCKFWELCDYPVKALPVNVSWCFSLDALFWPQEGSGICIRHSALLLEWNE